MNTLHGDITEYVHNVPVGRNDFVPPINDVLVHRIGTFKRTHRRFVADASCHVRVSEVQVGNDIAHATLSIIIFDEVRFSGCDTTVVADLQQSGARPLHVPRDPHRRTAVHGKVASPASGEQLV